MMASNLTMTRDRFGEVMRSLRALGEQDVLVGIPSDKAFRDPSVDGDSDPGVNNAMLGYIHENGSPAKNIPARPFLVPGVRAAREKIGDIFENDVRKMLGPGGGRNAEQTLHAVGLTAAASVKNKITDGPFVPLAPKTLAKRRAKGRKGTSPLIDTGQLRNSVTYVLGEK